MVLSTGCLIPFLMLAQLTAEPSETAVTSCEAASLPWDLAALSEPPRTIPAPGFEEEGVTAVFYEGLPHQGKPTRVFAWYGIPETAPGEKCPAMVLVHGGGGTAFAEWVRLWVGRGYAAIAMDTCGCVPKGEYGNWQRHEAGGPPGWGGFEHVDEPPTEQWTYHAVAAVIRAHSLIRSFPEVDPERTGITGISWGGYLTCIAAGADPRFKLAVPVYGCGFLGENSAWLEAFEKLGSEKAAKWLGLWDPSVYLPRAGMPLLWVTGTNDFAYPMDSLQKSYRLPTGPRTLCIRIRMPHGHHGPGENPEEIHAFAEHVLNGKAPRAKMKEQGRDGSEVWLSFEAQVPVTRAELIYTRDAGKWQDRNWEAAPARLNAAEGRVTATLPEGTTVYYINLIDSRDLIVSSEHVDLSAP
jgi:dienelactone hydrolase